MLKRNLKKRSPILTWGTVAALALTGFAVLGDQGLLKLKSMDQMEEQLATQITDIDRENQRLAQSIEALNDRDTLEQVVRGELGFLRDDEVLFYLGETRP